MSNSRPDKLGWHRYVESWKRHQALWKTEKASVMDKFKMKHPTNADFEEKLAKYAKLADDVWRQASQSACRMASLNMCTPGAYTATEHVSYQTTHP